MTCIVGLVHKGKVYIGGDSAGVAGMDLVVRRDRKVFVKDGFAIGFTTSFRMGQLLAYSLKIPPAPFGTNLMRFMVLDFVDAVRDCFKSGGWASKNQEQEVGGSFLVGTRGRLFAIESDYQVEEVTRTFHAAGCGAIAAIGAMYAMSGTLLPRKRVVKALSIAQKCSAGVRAPFYVVEA